MEMQAKMWQKDEKLRQLKEIVQVCSSQSVARQVFTSQFVLFHTLSLHNFSNASHKARREIFRQSSVSLSGFILFETAALFLVGTGACKKPPETPPFSLHLA